MHYHLEILLPHCDDVKAAVEEILLPFDENNDENRHAFWDWWQFGGRYSGRKIEAAVGQDKIDAFHEELKRRKVTCSGLVWGKQELAPDSQIPMVDALWREMCPGGGDVCTLFKHSGDMMNGDICAYKDLPAGLMAHRLIVAAPDYEGKKLEAEAMYSRSIWNGVNHEDTKWDGGVETGIAAYLEKLKSYKTEYAEKRTPKDDWLVVTVDYHS